MANKPCEHVATERGCLNGPLTRHIGAFMTVKCEKCGATGWIAINVEWDSAPKKSEVKRKKQ